VEVALDRNPNFSLRFVCMAAGCSNLFTFPVLQQFGLIFRERLAILGIPTAEITTMINMNQALTCLCGLANGPVFRRFTFRQVSFFGAMLVSLALFLTSFADSFVKFLITFSILYGEWNWNCFRGERGEEIDENNRRIWRWTHNFCQLVGPEHLLQRKAANRDR
jgi:hypothetical protein